MYIRIFILFCLVYDSVNLQMVFPDNRFLFSNENPLNEANQNKNYASRGLYEYKNRPNYDISTALNNFAININRITLNKMEETPTENIVMSPLSIVGSLSLITLGSVGKTYEELAYVLGFFNSIKESGDVHQNFGSLLKSLKTQNTYTESARNLSYGSAIFLQNNFPIRQQYRDMIKNVYESDITHVDFVNYPFFAREIINKWVYDRTYGKIQNILSDIPSADTRLIIANALYFNAEWEKHFFDGLTKKLPFTPDASHPQNQIMVDMMANEGFFPFLKSSECDCVILGLPYKGNGTTLYAIKPLDSTKKSLKQLMNELTGEKLLNLISNTERQQAIILFPRMKLTLSYNLKSILRDMGIRSVFSEQDSNLGLLSPATPAYTPTVPTNIFEDEQTFIFNRFGDENENETGCNHIFHSNDSSNLNCTTKQIVNGEPVQILYKKIGNQIGRRIIKRNAGRHPRTASSFNPGLYVDEIIHKVDIDITETGTEASASTIAFVTRHGKRQVFRGDEPFFFIIIDENTKLPLFMSTVYNPQAY